jgi:hypothetical protein
MSGIDSKKPDNREDLLEIVIEAAKKEKHQNRQYLGLLII